MVIEYGNGLNIDTVNQGECIEYAGDIYMRIVDIPDRMGCRYPFISLSDGELHWFSKYADHVSIVNAKVVVD